jgi:hypothetical protein
MFFSFIFFAVNVSLAYTSLSHMCLSSCYLAESDDSPMMAHYVPTFYSISCATPLVFHLQMCVCDYRFIVDLFIVLHTNSLCTSGCVGGVSVPWNRLSTSQNNRAALALAIEHGNTSGFTECVRMLIGAGADKEAIDNVRGTGSSRWCLSLRGCICCRKLYFSIASTGVRLAELCEGRPRYLNITVRTQSSDAGCVLGSHGVCANATRCWGQL